MFIKITIFVFAFLLAQIFCASTYKFAYNHTVVYFGLNEKDEEDSIGIATVQLAANQKPQVKEDSDSFEYVTPKRSSALRNIYFVFCFIWLSTGLYLLFEMYLARQVPGQANQNIPPNNSYRR